MRPHRDIDVAGFGERMFGSNRRKHVAIQTLIGAGTRINGDLHFEGGCHIDGVVHGSVVSDRYPEGYLSLSEDGRVEGSVSVPRVILNGTVQGDVHASEHVELGTTARVVGDLYYELLEMVAGAEVNGKLIHEPGATKEKQKLQARLQPKTDDKGETVPASGVPAS